MSTGYDVAVVGATGLVGEALLSILAEREFPVRKLYALASHRSAGEVVLFQNKPILVEDADQFDWSQVQLALFSAGSAVSEVLVPRATQAGCIVIDNTAYFRMDEGVPLVIPEVNRDEIARYVERGIIANPNCSTIQMLVALKPIYDQVGIERINVCTYQSVSGTGRKAIEELTGQVGALLNGQMKDPEVYPCTIAFNVIPEIDKFMDNGYSKEEMKMHLETQKILQDPNIQVNATTVRVPVLYGHSEAIHLETSQKISAQAVHDLLKGAPGVIVRDELQQGGYPTPLTDVSATDGVYVGRIREDFTHPRGINLWVVADNIRKGAALNAIQIAELLVQDYF